MKAKRKRGKGSKNMSITENMGVLMTHCQILTLTQSQFAYKETKTEPLTIARPMCILLNFILSSKQ